MEAVQYEKAHGGRTTRVIDPTTRMIYVNGYLVDKDTWIVNVRHTLKSDALYSPVTSTMSEDEMNTFCHVYSVLVQIERAEAGGGTR